MATVTLIVQDAPDGLSITAELSGDPAIHPQAPCTLAQAWGTALWALIEKHGHPLPETPRA